MIDDRIGYRYAKSLFDLAKEKNLLDDVKVDMELIHLTSVQNRDFRSMLNSPLISPGKKKTILQALFKGKFDTDFTKHLVEIMIRKGREKYLDNAAKAFLQLYDLEKHIQRGKLISATPLSDDAIAAIKKEVERETGDEFEMDVEIDPSLIGGFILKIGDRIFDGSISSSLRKLEQEFQTKTYIKQF